MSALEVAAGERAIGLGFDLAGDRLRERDQRGHQRAVDQLRPLGGWTAGNVEEPVPLDGPLGRDRPEAEQVRNRRSRPDRELSSKSALSFQAVAEPGASRPCARLDRSCPREGHPVGA